MLEDVRLLGQVDEGRAVYFRAEILLGYKGVEVPSRVA